MDKQLDAAPLEVLKRYEKWKDVAMLSGPAGLRWIKEGHWRGYRSYRLGLKYRVIYRVLPEKSLFQVAYFTPHDY